MESDRLLCQTLASELDSVVARALDGRVSVALFDVPYHANAGDHLITQGELDVFARLGVRVTSMATQSATCYASLPEMGRGTAVVLQGGGSFGGLWPGCDEYRARLIRSAGARNVIIMPQSVFFPSKDHAARARQLYGQFDEATYLIRDSRSASRLVAAVPELSDSVHLCPDAAFGTTLSRERLPAYDVRVLQRSDKERALSERISFDTCMSTRYGDWPNMKATTFVPEYKIYRATHLVLRGTHSFLGSCRPGRPMSRRAHRLASAAGAGMQRWAGVRWTKGNVRSLTDTLSLGRVLVTDRLHAHVAATLLGIPNIVVSSIDDKAGALIEDWTSKFTTTHQGETKDDVEGQVRQLLRRYR